MLVEGVSALVTNYVQRREL